MKVTWKDGVTTVSTAGAIVLERAYYHNYDWSLVSSIRWVVGGLAILGAINLILGFAFDKDSNEGWDVMGIFLGVGLATLTTLGLVYAVTDYVMGMMLAAIAIWVISLAHHAVEHSRPQMFIHA